MKRLIVLLALFTAMPTLAVADFQRGLQAARSGDYAAALREWKPLAEQGNAEAQHQLAMMYRGGRGVPQDYVEALKWYRLAAEQGNANAQFGLGAGYYHGSMNMPQDYAKAVKWFRRAADQGIDGAQYFLGTIYQDGLGVPQDYVQAHMWFNLSAASGNPFSHSNRNSLASKMTSTQIAEAQRLATKWKRK